MIAGTDAERDTIWNGMELIGIYLLREKKRDIYNIYSRQYQPIYRYSYLFIYICIYIPGLMYRYCPCLRIYICSIIICKDGR